MAIIKWDPFFNDIDKFFEEDIIPFVPTLKVNDLPVDVYEKEGKVFVEMPLSGYGPENISVEAEGNRLKIAGKVEKKEREEKKNYYRKEIKRSSFEKIVQLPEGVSAEKGEAEIKDGFLRVVFPFIEESKKVKKLEIKRK